MLLQHPQTGEQVHASKRTAARLIEEEGWETISETKYAVTADTSTAEPPAADPPAGTPQDGEDGGVPSPDKPLSDMKMPELVAYAEKIGMPDAAALKKPGSSKVKAIAAIEEFVASQSQE